MFNFSQFRSVQSLSRVRLFATPWIAAHKASLSITNSRSSLKLKSIKSVMPSNHLILCCPLLLLPSVFPSIRVFSSESVLHMRWSKYWNFGFSISPSNDHKHTYKCHDMSLCKFIRKTPFPGSLPWIPCLGWLGKLFMGLWLFITYSTSLSLSFSICKWGSTVLSSQVC